MAAASCVGCVVMADADRILEFVNRNPGKKAKDIAAQLAIDKQMVNSVLHGTLRKQLRQDSSYRWWPKQHLPAPGSDGALRPQVPDTVLSRLCQYYLDCLSHDDQDGVSVFASSSFSRLDYAELRGLPQIDNGAAGILQDEGPQSILNRAQRDLHRLTPLLGYPAVLSHIRSRKGWEGFLVQPVLLFRAERDAVPGDGQPILFEDRPQINFAALRSLVGADRSVSVAEEAAQLSEELGLAGDEPALPDLEELVPRLRDIRSEWEWKEELNPYHLNLAPPISQIQAPGIYNRALLIAAERSPYTRGLENELHKLRSVSEAECKGTALAMWLRTKTDQAQMPANQLVLEPLPLNSEQRQAVLRGLSSPLTVITGPPGTGKSQVVTSLLINAAWRGITVLFASKNNKAVDVVQTRVNALGPRPILLRLGANELQARLAEYLVGLLGAVSTDTDEKIYQEYITLNKNIYSQSQALDAQIADTIQLRNEVDRMERLAEPVRQEVGPDLFHSFCSSDEARNKKAAALLLTVVARASRHDQPLPVRLLWPLLKKARYVRLRDECKRLQPWVEEIGLSSPGGEPSDLTVGEWATLGAKVEARVQAIARVRQYAEHLERLTAGRSLEEMARQHLRLTHSLAEISESLWRSWLRLIPKRLTPEDRRLLNDYSAVLQLIVTANQEERRLGRQAFARYHSLFPKITRLLPCWAVTSLSAHGRVPFEPAFFDLLIIDEASQCDIASALPLLFRSRRAVIIGDPKQLRHISGLPPSQDRELLEKYNLVGDQAAWSYSVRSLFELASGLCSSEDVIQLRDHHRSHADIIDFSNSYFYEGRLRVATKYEGLRRPSNDGPAIRWIDVRGKVVRPSSGGALNEEEAKAVVEEIERLVLRQGYKGSIGVISPFRAQANRIRDFLARSGDLAGAVQQHDFLADTVHRFQGDERDLMLFSPVVSQGISAGALAFLRNNPNLFNVAITRARAALIVVGDRQAAIASDVEYLAQFARYVEQIGTSKRDADPRISLLSPDYPVVATPELVSDWEKVLYRALYAAGIRAVPQYQVEKYTLDLAILNGQRMLDIEVDGETYHRNWDGELCRRDQIRNLRLYELGWDVMRFWVYQVRDDLSGCVKRIKAWVDAG